MKTTALVALATLFILPAYAVELTKREEGRALVSQCYMRCGFDALSLEAAYEANYTAKLQIFNDIVGRSARSGVDLTQYPLYDELLQDTQQGGCRLVQSAANSADLCDAGCRDLEQVYGNVNSWAKTRFRYHFNEAKAKLKAVGLWSNYKDWPPRRRPIPI